MARPNPLRVLMETPLPNISQQKKKCYRPTLREANRIYDIINKHVFKGRLVRPPIVLGRCRKYWGMCSGSEEYTRRGTKCRIKLASNWYCIQWFVTTLAHEMVHQYEWDILEKNMTHRQSFFVWRERMAQFGISLKTYHRYKKWLKYQDLSKS